MIVDNIALPTDPVMLSQLPPLAVDSMTQIQLTEFIPQLVTLVTGRQHPLFGKSQYRPDWWPQDVSWSWPGSDDIKQSENLKHSDDLKQDELKLEMLRKIVTSCYKHLDQENLLSAASLPQENKGTSQKLPVTRVLFEHDGNQNAVCSQENPKPTVTQGPPQEESPTQANNPIWVCFLCAKQFTNQSDLMVHQDKCENEEEEAEAEKETVSKVLPTQFVPNTLPFQAVPTIISAQTIQIAQPKRMGRSRVIPTRLVQRRRRRFREIYIPPPKDVFIKLLDLGEKPRDDSAPVVKEEHVDSDCEIIDVEMVTTPVTPRTPKSLMSQLSRDAEGSHRKRQLSFSGLVSDSDSGGESTTKETKPAPAICSLLLNIDLSSPLGHRVKKQLKIDNTIPIISKADIYCRGYDKNNFFEKLRQRESAYPCTFKKKRKHAQYHHRMKFSSSQRREFMITQKTGLNRKSRKLLSQMEPCKVELEHMDPAEVKEWLRPKPRPLMPNYYQQARYAQAVFSRTSSNARQFSNEVIQRAIGKPLCGPLSAKIRHMNQSLASLSKMTPIPRSYMVTQVVKNADGSETMRMVHDQNSAYRPVYRSQAAAAASRRKQNFVSERLERSNNEVEIIDLSSSDEEKEPIKQEVRKPIKAIHRANILSKVFKPSGSFQPRPSGSGLQNSTTLSRPHPYVHIPTSNPKGFSIHSSPPGARTCKELQQRPVAVGGTRVSEFGGVGQGLVIKSPSPGPGLRISSVYSLQDSQSEQVRDNSNYTTIRYQGGLLAPAGPRPQLSRPPGIRPPGIRPQIINSANVRQGPPRMVRGPRPEPVKTSVHKMEVTGKNNDTEVVDVICIDDDD
ncbi:uncharacterized protein LOC110455023 [Mizuhopecten yessoensis]|uniref:Nuclear respiratory factor 1 n=1 Tax=Mizuhopecten yessoensis TaxID=6573 RepID=A0A210R4Q6_MIZYE|nr:uncharacterized protein LOC110455023 [Mizuhopecten yessoensis]XP_021360593.1 uncharacterized protein LOC110455023 [Mizuhopecten yessoensis]OWF55894.1 Nuclear respiratory factor 1 [Mizuhopecten yessoensis]